MYSERSLGYLPETTSSIDMPVARRGVLKLFMAGGLATVLAACTPSMPYYIDERDYPDDVLAPEEAASEASATEKSLEDGKQTEAKRLAGQNRESYHRLHQLVLGDRINSDGENFIQAMAGQLHGRSHDVVEAETTSRWTWSVSDQQLIEFRSGGRAYQDLLTVSKTAQYREVESGARRRLTADVGLLVMNRALRDVDSPAEAWHAIHEHMDDLVVQSVATKSTPLADDGSSILARTSEKSIRAYFRQSNAGSDDGLPVVSGFYVVGAPSIENQAGAVLPEVENRLRRLAA